MTRCVAHRGGSLLAPENTAAAFEAGIAAGADWVECDVHLSRDGELVVIHDSTLERTTDLSGPVRELTLAEIKRADAAAKFRARLVTPQRILTLHELLEMLAGRVGLQVEIKTFDRNRYAGIEEKVLAALVHAELIERSLVICFNPAVLERCKALNPSCRTGLLIAEQHLPAGVGTLAGRITVAAQACLADAVGLEFALAEPQLVEAFTRAGLGTAVWTVNAESDMLRFRDMNLEAIASDRPDLLRRVLDADD
jgi:glycerophosphoryl diester phosphodiesterase